MYAEESTLLLRADANPEIGVGHVMRVLTIAEGWQLLGGKAVLLSHNLPAGLIDRCVGADIAVMNLGVDPGTSGDVAETSAMVSRVKADWLVVDGYRLGRLIGDQRGDIKVPILVIDDFGLSGMDNADLLLDQNAGTTEDCYRSNVSKLLLGRRYCLLRQEFIAARRSRAEVPERVRCLLVTLGGADSANVTTTVLRAIAACVEPDCEIKVVIGGANRHHSAIGEQTRAMKQPVTLLESVENMAELMANTDLAVGAPGVTSWELAYMGVPMALISLAENQRRNGEFLAQAGVGHYLGPHDRLETEQIQSNLRGLMASRDRRRQMSDRGRCLIDGRGVDRVCRHLRAEAFRLDPATTDDARRLWEWSNDPDVRAGSFSTEPIPWETHVTWLKKRLCDPTCRIYIVCDCSGQGLGQVRFEINGRTATISIGLALAARGRGYGSQLVWMACARLFDNTDVDRVEALIRLDNAGSIRVFEKAEFVSVGETEVKQQPARRFTLERGQFA